MNTLPQTPLLERLRAQCRADERLAAAMLYGSTPLGEADRFSDIDVLLYFADDRLGEVDPRAWVERIAPLELFYVNDHGIHAAVFDNLVRAEFHFDPASKMAEIDTWRGLVWFPSAEAAVLLDRTGELARRLQTVLAPPPERDTPETVRSLAHNFLNWYLYGLNVLARGERARALEALNLIHGYMLRMARLRCGSTRHWINAARLLEAEIAPEAYARFAGCTGRLEPGSPEAAYRAAWRWGVELMRLAAEPHAVDLPESLIEKLERRVGALLG